MPTIANQGITRGELREFEQGDWFADVATNSSERIPNGTRVEIVAENKTWSGAIVRGDITEAVGRYQVAGRPEWGNAIAARPSAAYRSASAVQQNIVLGDIARETLGASWASLVVMPSAATLGQHFERPGTKDATLVTARDLLALLEVPWYVRTDGITVFGTRPTGNVTTEQRVLVEYRNDAIGYRVVNCEDVAAFAPGLTFENEVIGEITYSFLPTDVKLHVWTRAASSTLSDWLQTVWRRLFPRAELQGSYTYVVVGPSQSGKHDLRSIRSRHLPDVKTAESWSIAGHYAELTAGTQVLVAFRDADPSSPVLVAVAPNTTPVTASFDAVSSVEIDALSVELGTAEAPVIRSGDAVTIATLPGPVIIAAGLLFRTADIATPVPTVLPTKVKA